MLVVHPTCFLPGHHNQLGTYTFNSRNRLKGGAVFVTKNKFTKQFWPFLDNSSKNSTPIFRLTDFFQPLCIFQPKATSQLLTCELELYASLKKFGIIYTKRARKIPLSRKNC
jgi:hypothetical protein